MITGDTQGVRRYCHYAKYNLHCVWVMAVLGYEMSERTRRKVRARSGFQKDEMGLQYKACALMSSDEEGLKEGITESCQPYL
jgi:hypothetical protein